MYTTTEVQKDIFKTIIKKKDFKNSVFTCEDEDHELIAFIYYFYYIPASDFRNFYLKDVPGSNFYHTSLDGFKKILDRANESRHVLCEGYRKDSKNNSYIYIEDAGKKHYFNKKIIDKFGSGFLDFTYNKHILYIYDPDTGNLIGGVCETRFADEKT